jgi:glutamine---fructose-6-phosphate transaminase (isomerizing)
MNHGPIALIDSNTPTVFLVPLDSMYDKTMANLRSVMYSRPAWALSEWPWTLL